MMNLDFSFYDWGVISNYVLKGFYFSVFLTVVATLEQLGEERPEMHHRLTERLGVARAGEAMTLTKVLDHVGVVD